jgi:hypothetical protein
MDIEAVLDRWLGTKQDSYIDLIIADRVFGGRLGESPQRPTAFQMVGPVLAIRFDSTERLTVAHPSGARVGSSGELIIPDALDVRFGWHYYGRPQIPANWCEEIYWRDANRVELVRTGPLHPETQVFRYKGSEFVKLL